MVQDSEQPNLGVGVDLIDLPGTPLTTAVACDPNFTPCQVQYTLGGAGPDFSCVNTKTGMPVGPIDPSAMPPQVDDPCATAGTCFCNDPLALAPGATVPIPTASSNPPAPGAYGGAQIRLVFNKLLSDDIEAPDSDPRNAAAFKLNDGIVELKENGAAVPSFMYWDPTGSPTQTSDPVNIPFGPAIVIKPLATLDSNTTYTIVVHSAQIHDRKGNGMADQFGAPQSGDMTFSFTTAATSLVSASPDITVVPSAKKPQTTIVPDNVVTMQFNAAMDPASFTVTKLTPALPAGLTLKAFSDSQTDTSGLCWTSPAILDIAPVDASGALANWPAGDYTLSFTVKSKSGEMVSLPDDMGGTFVFTVAPEDPTMDSGDHMVHLLTCSSS